MLRVTQTGTGEALRIEDEANPDTSPFVVGADGRVGIHGTPATNTNHKLAIYNGNIVFSAGYGLAFGDGTTQTTAPNMAGYAQLSGAEFTGNVSFNGGNLKLPLGAYAALGAIQGQIWHDGTSNFLVATYDDTIDYLVKGADLTYALSLRPVLDASNQFTRSQVITANSSLPTLRLTQTGTGPALVVEDATNPDASSFVVNQNGVVGIGQNPATWTPATGTALDVVGGVTLTNTLGGAGLTLVASGVNAYTTSLTSTSLRVGYLASNQAYGLLNTTGLLVGSDSTGRVSIDTSSTGAYNPFITLTEAGPSAVLQGRTTTIKEGKFLVNDNTGGADYEPYLSSANLSGYALLSGATFTGKVTFTATSTTSGINLTPVSATPTGSVAGDVWIGQFNMFFKNATGVTRTIPNTESQNFFSQPQIIGTSSSATLPALRITNASTIAGAHSLLVEDATNPDTSSFIINNAGVVGIQRDPATWTPSAGVFLDVGGKGVFTTTVAYAGVNVGVATTAPTTTVAGDVWVGTNNIFFKDSTNTQRTVPALNTVNQFTVGQAISVNSASNALRINQIGTGPALVVEDSTNPDTTAFVVDASGNVGVGVNPTWTATRKLEVVGSISCTTEPATSESIDVATTAHVKSVIRGQIISDATTFYDLPTGSLPNVVIKKLSDGNTGTVTQVIIPLNSVNPIPVGSQFVIIQVDAQQVMVVKGNPSINLFSSGSKYKTSGQNSVCTLIKTDTNEWYLAGDLTT